MGRWAFKVDLASGGKIALFNIVYLTFLLLIAPPYSITIQFNPNIFLSNHLYIYFQYIETIICVFGAVWVYEETFKHKTYEFILSFPIHKAKIILVRFFQFTVCFYGPLCPSLIIASYKLNNNIVAYCVQKGMPASTIPSISAMTLIFQSLVVINFFVVLSLFLLWIFHDKTIPLVLILAYCALEYGPMSRILGNYCLFRGAFNLPDYYHLFTPNLRVLLPVSIIMFTIVYYAFGNLKCNKFFAFSGKFFTLNK